SNWRMIQCLFT
ncbi:glutathione S-transferase, N-terminal domain protein, partial [Vibrio parahaemolyticus V-223/04]